jgi:hypothetical protein
MSGAFGSAWAGRRASQLLDLTPIDFALFTRAMPAANSGASRPLSVAATAGVRDRDARRAGGAASMICAGPVGGWRNVLRVHRHPGPSASGWAAMIGPPEADWKRSQANALDEVCSCAPSYQSRPDCAPSKATDYQTGEKTFAWLSPFL